MYCAAWLVVRYRWNDLMEVGGAPCVVHPGPAALHVSSSVFPLWGGSTCYVCCPPAICCARAGGGRQARWGRGRCCSCGQRSQGPPGEPLQNPLHDHRWGSHLPAASLHTSRRRAAGTSHLLQWLSRHCKNLSLGGVSTPACQRAGCSLELPPHLPVPGEEVMRSTPLELFRPHLLDRPPPPPPPITPLPELTPCSCGSHLHAPLPAGQRDDEEAFGGGSGPCAHRAEAGAGGAAALAAAGPVGSHPHAAQGLQA